MNENERRQALADFLCKHRAQLSPADVGLPPGLRRRTPGLRREEVAQLANMSPSWYIWLEQGRNIHPSVQVLESLAQALRLTLNERRHLFLLAGQSLPPQTPPLQEHISPVLRQMLSDLDPAPAYVMGRRFDYLAWNNAAEKILAISTASLSYERNLVWRFFTDPMMREHFSHWEQMARGLLAEFRAASSLGDEWFEELIEALKQASPEFCRWWQEHDAPRELSGNKIMEHATLGHLEFQHLTLQVLSDPDVRVSLYMPNATTRIQLQRLLKDSDQPEVQCTFNQQASTAKDSPTLLERLTPQEQRVLRLLAQGASNQEIADQLVIQYSTAKKHVANLLSKLGAKNRTQAVVRARAYALQEQESDELSMS